MTAQSKVNIEAATDAKLIPKNGGYQIQLTGKNGSAFIENADGPIVHTSMATAEMAMKKYNSGPTPSLIPTI